MSGRQRRIRAKMAEMQSSAPPDDHNNNNNDEDEDQNNNNNNDNMIEEEEDIEEEEEEEEGYEAEDEEEEEGGNAYGGYYGDRKKRKLIREMKRRLGGSDSDDGGGCKRWMVWAAYIDPTFKDDDYEEDGRRRAAEDDNNGQEDPPDYYFADDHEGKVDCHKSSTNWKLLGVYKISVHMFIQQLMKHIWATGEFDYKVAQAVYQYVGNGGCNEVGYDPDDNNSVLYGGVMPLAGGDIRMALYTDEDCLIPYNGDLTYDDFASFEPEDDQYFVFDDATYSEMWEENVIDYRLTYFNEMFDMFKTCNLCIDYPSYQDGEDTNDINQCWKFYSHNSPACEGDCIAMAMSQGTIRSIQFGDLIYYGSITERETSRYYEPKYSIDQDYVDHVAANTFLAASLIFCIGASTFYLYMRGSRYKLKRPNNDKAVGLLGDESDDDDVDHNKEKSRVERLRSRRRSRSRKKDRIPEDSERRSSSRRDSERDYDAGDADMDYDPTNAVDISGADLSEPKQSTTTSVPVDVGPRSSRE
mmetsp:Transcript_3814/g.5816  ORF Transcript_3814/g.5816 Transcript_3814/m.5816 type:complete len:526 (+) Transcript_3814:231-1808(+)